MLGHRVLNVEDYVSILKRRAWIIAIPVVIVPVIAYALTFLIAPVFLSQTFVIVEGQKVPDDLVKPVVSSDLSDQLASMKEQILSRSHIEPIVNRFNLFPGSASLDARIEAVRKNIEVKQISSDIAHSSGLPGFYITFKAGDPHTAQLVCGEILSLFINEDQRSRDTTAHTTTSFIQSQLSDAKRSLDEQDRKLAEFQQRYSGKLPDQSGSNVNMLSTLNTQLEASTQALQRLQQDKSYMESMLAQQQQQQAALAATASGGAGGNSIDTQQKELEILIAKEADLSAHYTDDYPDVIAVRRQIAEMRRQIARTAAAPPAPVPSGPSKFDSAAIQQLRAQIKATDLGIEAKRQEQASIQSQVRMYQDRIQSTPEVEQQYKQLTRDYQNAQAFYNDLLTKMNQSKMAVDLEKRQEGQQFRVMDEPNLPESPYSPKRGAFVLAGIAGGFALGLIIVAFIEYKDTTLRSERDVWAFTQLPTLAIIGYTDAPMDASPRGLRNLFRSRSEKVLSEANG
jgi:polysaccharide chain length determinant protein (PEP-CTERM system associated)